MACWVHLTKDGLRTGDAEGEECLVPRTLSELLRAWHYVLNHIDQDFTLGDLLALLRGVQGVEQLSGMLHCDVASFLAEAEHEPTSAEDQEILFLEVCNEAELTSYDEDPNQPDEPERILEPEEVEDHDAMMDALQELIGERVRVKVMKDSGNDPLTGSPVRRRIVPASMNGRWSGPYHVHRAFRAWRRWSPPPELFAPRPEGVPEALECGVGVELMPVNELVHTPLRYNPAITLCDGSGAVLVQDGITITFGELVHAVFASIGILGTPDDRDAHREFLEERIADFHAELERERERRGEWR
ncbi:MAG TPA: hypothetical protein VF771_05030 [Longimicrobiaceae bacterium]